MNKICALLYERIHMRVYGRIIKIVEVAGSITFTVETFNREHINVIAAHDDFGYIFKRKPSLEDLVTFTIDSGTNIMLDFEVH